MLLAGRQCHKHRGARVYPSTGVRGGMASISSAGTARASLGLYNGLADLDALVAAIHKAQALFGTRGGTAPGKGRAA